MKIVLLAHKTKHELMVQICMAYANVLAGHELFTVESIANAIADESTLTVKCLDMTAQEDIKKIGSRLAYNEFDLALFFNDPDDENYLFETSCITRGCDIGNIPLATNSATAEALLLALGRGDLDWREFQKK